MSRICPPTGVFRKKQFSTLDPYMPQLFEMAGQGKSLAEMQTWLIGQDPNVAKSIENIRRIMKSRGFRQDQEACLSCIRKLSDLCRSLDQAYAKNPVPGMQTIIDVFKSKIMDLAARADKDPNYLKIADQLARTALGFLAEENRSGFKERELAMAEQKYGDTKKSQHTKALELCLDETRAFPEVQELFRAAFAALKKARQPNPPASLSPAATENEKSS